MSRVTIWHFIRQNAYLAALVIAGFLALGFVFLRSRLMRTKARKQKRQRLAACWLATLSELSQALDYMQDKTRRLIHNRQRHSPLVTIHKSEVFRRRWLHDGFLQMAGDQAGTSLVGSLNRDCDFFKWHLRQAAIAWSSIETSDARQVNRVDLQQPFETPDAATIMFACNHHHGMVRDWKKSAAFLETYCSDHELERGVGLLVPTEFPLKWQRDDAKPWTIETLAHVGEDKWEP